jgi:rare lipoprotein A (peptidoglycan hydrolase)
VRGRIIDVTPAAAHALGFNGLAPVKLDVLHGSRFARGALRPARSRALPSETDRPASAAAR